MRLSQASQASALPAVTTFAATPTRSIPTLPQSLDHLKQYLTLLLSRQFGAR